MPLHPLVKQAAMSFDIQRQVRHRLEGEEQRGPSGRYEFAIYQWQFHGIKEDLLLRPIASVEMVTTHLASLLEKAEAISTAEQGSGGSPAWDVLNAQHYRLWSEAREKHRRRTQELAEYRRESLATSHRARISLLAEQLKQSSNEKIQKMRQSQIAAAEADYARHTQELNIAVERADVTAGPVAYGVLFLMETVVMGKRRAYPQNSV